MLTDPQLIAVQYLAGQVKSRLATIRDGQLDRGGMSLEWSLIAVGLVVMALAVGAFLLGKLHGFEKQIP